MKRLGCGAHHGSSDMGINAGIMTLTSQLLAYGPTMPGGKAMRYFCQESRIFPETIHLTTNVHLLSNTGHLIVCRIQMKLPI